MAERVEVEMLEIIIAVIVAAGIPSAVCGILLKRMDKKIEQREIAREKHNMLLVKGVQASIALGEATALALKRGKTNGETEAALEYAKEAKHEIKDFLTEQAVRSII